MKTGWVEATTEQPVIHSAWAVQVLPNVVNVSASSIPKLAEESARLLVSRLKPLLQVGNAERTASNSALPPTLWELHGIPSAGTAWQGEMKLLEKALLKELRSTPVNKFRYHSSYRPLQPGDLLVQCLLKEPTTLSISVSSLTKTAFFWNRPLPWLSGYLSIHSDEKYPAESFKKCKEILHHLGISLVDGLKGKKVVELGATPGGWTMVLLEAGAQLNSVDWADLENPWLTSHPNLIHRREDARIFDPVQAGILSPSSAISVGNSEEVSEKTSVSLPRHVDYLFADLALPPEKSLVAFERWLTNRWTKAFAWTFKFGFHTGDQYAVVIDRIRKMLDAHGPNLVYSVRHLYMHENEIVVLGGWLGL